MRIGEFIKTFSLILLKGIYYHIEKTTDTYFENAELQKKINLLKAKYNNNSILNSILFNLNCSIVLYI